MASDLKNTELLTQVLAGNKLFIPLLLFTL